MSKTFRLAFNKGINVVGDKALLPEGFATVLDNVDLRSGCLRPYRSPEYQFQVDNATVNSWSYRGRWFHSPRNQEHVGEYIGGIERVYTTEEGKFPTKTIEGDTVLMGTPRPKTILGVSKSGSLAPAGITTTVSYAGKGNLPDGNRYYRVAAKTADGVLPPSPPFMVVIEDTAHGGASVEITWGAVPKALSYLLFEGDGSAQLLLEETSSSTLRYEDTGAKTASGDNAAQYLQEQPFTYGYTYKRNVNQVFDEGGISAVSIPITSVTGRLITRDFLNDGYFDQQVEDPANPGLYINTAVTGTGSIASASSSTYPAITLTGCTITYRQSTAQVHITKASHGLLTGDKLMLTGSTDPAWANQSVEVIYVDANTFAIASFRIPSDAVIGSDPNTGTLSTMSAQREKSNVTYSATDVVETDDVVYLVGTGVSGLYKATKISDTSFSVPLLTTSAVTLTTVKWIPKNGYYWKWELYRNEQGGWFLVDEIDLDKTTYTDAKPFASLGGTPTSYYAENGITIDYDIPPVSLTSIESHYGMLFAISGHTVRWTPILTPDAWPEVFSVTLAYKPVKLASFAQGLIILCQDAIYRLDGNSPTGMSLSKTQAEDGCFAPGSVQKTDRGLMYLSKRGIMLFNGTHAECLTDTRVQGAVLNGPSKVATPLPFWWLPTTMTKNYADLAGEDGITSHMNSFSTVVATKLVAGSYYVIADLGTTDFKLYGAPVNEIGIGFNATGVGTGTGTAIPAVFQYVFNMDNNKSIDGLNKDVKSMYHQGKFYLFFTGPNYQGNTCFVVDMQLEGFPITTMGAKITDCHVDEYETAYLLFENVFSPDYEASKLIIPGGDPQLIGKVYADGNNGWGVMLWGNDSWGSPYIS